LETGVPLGNEGFSSKEGKLATGPSGSVESPKAERFWVWSSGNVASGLASDLVLRDLNQSGVREPREGDDFGQNFLGVFRVPDAIRNSQFAIRHPGSFDPTGHAVVHILLGLRRGLRRMR